MKRIAFVISLLTISCTIARAQQAYFIFIWSDNQQPFYVRLAEKTYSSSAIGHLIIPRLQDSTYSLVVGFPKKQFPEYAFVVSFNKKDLDYQLKNTAGEGWVLFNAQTSETVKPRQDNLVKTTNPSLGERKTGAFATLMSGLVNDSAVMYKSIAKADIPVQPAAEAIKKDTAVTIKEEPAQTGLVVATAPAIDSVQAEKKAVVIVTDSLKKDSLTARVSATPGNITGVKDSAVAVIPVRADSVVPAPAPVTPAPLSVVTKAQEWWNDKGKGLIYYDSSAAGTDTISIVIDFRKDTELPAPGEVIAAPARVDSVKTAILTPDTAVAKKQDQPAKDSTEKIAAITPDAPAKDATEKVVARSTPDDSTEKVVTVKTTPDSPVVAAVVKADTGKVKADSAVAKTGSNVVNTDSAAAVAAAKKPLLLMNSDCINFASEYDVDKLRVKMMGAANVDDRIGVAKKVFKTKCFVTRYIRGLSELFSSDEARFKFFDAAYPFVSDTGNFRQLLDLFTDELYIARFKSLVRM